MNHNNAHWTAAVINFRKKRIESYDSMGMERVAVFKVLRQYLDEEHRNKKKKPFDFTGWEDYTLPVRPLDISGMSSLDAGLCRIPHNKRMATTAVSSPASSSSRCLAAKRSSGLPRTTCPTSVGRWSGRSGMSSFGTNHSLHSSAYLVDVSPPLLASLALG